MKQGKKISWRNFPISIILAASALICIVPFWLVLVSSVTPEADIVSKGYSLFPTRIDFTAYRILLADAGRILNGITSTVCNCGWNTFKRGGNYACGLSHLTGPGALSPGA
ncbi:MAG: hypothetical protein QM683_00525 [Lacrimispora sp.]